MSPLGLGKAPALGGSEEARELLGLRGGEQRRKRRSLSSSVARCGRGRAILTGGTWRSGALEGRFLEGVELVQLKEKSSVKGRGASVITCYLRHFVIFPNWLNPLTL